VRFTLVEEAAAQVVQTRHIADAEPTAARIERDPGQLQHLYHAQKRISGSAGLEAVIREIADSALSLVPGSTHATIMLCDDEQAADPSLRMVPVLTRVRGPDGQPSAPSGPVQTTRSVTRQVVKERVAVLAADASEVMGRTASLLGASIRSTIGVPLWRGDDLIGVIQVDNRSAPRMLGAGDVEILLALAANASLAVANARLIRRLEAAEERLDKENRFLKTREEKRRSGGGKQLEIIGDSEPMRRLISQLDKVVDTRVTVLVEGETGTGKELIAAAVHYRSRRRDKLFVAQNCAALAENLLESELFGHKKGSFTGATEEKKGLFEIADGGTLFLDEITETPLSLQSKLLRALQEGEIRPVGATASKLVNVRIVAATNRDLEEEVRRGRFREDLYYRLKVFPLRLPPLRERRADVPLLVRHFLALWSAELGKPIAGVTQPAMELLSAYDWPGNVRELQNEVQRLAIQVDAGAFVTPELLSPRVRQVEGLVERAGVARGTLKDMIDTVEKYLLVESLREHGNNKTNAAKTLGITREGLHKKLRQFGL
jgi:transcriptional regulator with GAF, ATPase, and Fis domain